eukprot:COSAG04_NODE_574_length_12520_cov_55.989936_11_plen_48_part_00
MPSGVKPICTERLPVIVLLPLPWRKSDNSLDAKSPNRSGFEVIAVSS